MSNFFLVFILLIVISGCGGQGSSDPVFQKAEGYLCQNNVIPNEYLIRYRNGNIRVVQSKDDQTFLQQHFESQKNEILLAEPNYQVNLESEFLNDSRGSRKENNGDPTYDNWGAVATAADSYWSQGQYGQNILVAVIDTGIDINHAQLQDRIEKNEGEMGFDENGSDKRFNGIDDDSNGYVDDWAGYDFYHDAALAGDNSTHGTHVTGIIAASHSSVLAGPTKKYTQGMAPQSHVLPVAFLGEDGGSIDDAIRAIRYSVMRGAQIINASWGGTGCSATLRQEIQDLQNKNVLFIAAAGNEGQNLENWPEYPAIFESLTQITVGWINSDFSRAAQSNYSSRFVHLFAPGGAIFSTVPGNGYASYSGTSMATPFVSGAAALIWAQNPQLSAIEVKNQILKSVLVNPEYENQTQGRLAL